METRDGVISIYQWVKENIKYAFPRWGSMDETIKKRKGHCVAKSEVLVSMLRDKGIKARYVEGHNTKLRKLPIMWLKSLDSHFWVEAKIGNKWLCLDPTPDSGIINLWGDTIPGMHLGQPEYTIKLDGLPPWYKEGYNSFLFWAFRFLTNIELAILRCAKLVRRGSGQAERGEAAQ